MADKRVLTRACPRPGEGNDSFRTETCRGAVKKREKGVMRVGNPQPDCNPGQSGLPQTIRSSPNWAIPKSCSLGNALSGNGEAALCTAFCPAMSSVAGRPPTKIGAMVSTTKSTSCWRRKLLITAAPPSTIRLSIPSSHRRASKLGRCTLPIGSAGMVSKMAPAAVNEYALFQSARLVVAIQGDRSRSNLAPRGNRNWLSRTTGWGSFPCA